MLFRNKPVVVIRLVGLLVFFLVCWVATQKLHPTEELYYPTELDFARIEGLADRTFHNYEMGGTEYEVRAILGPPHKIVTCDSSSRWFHRPISLERGCSSTKQHKKRRILNHTM